MRAFSFAPYPGPERFAAHRPDCSRTETAMLTWQPWRPCRRPFRRQADSGPRSRVSQSTAFVYDISFFTLQCTI